MDSFLGRFTYYFQVANPLNSFASKQKILNSKALLEAHKARVEAAEKTGEKMALSEEEQIKLQKAEYLVASSVHPTTGEVIPWPCRTCSFTTTNIPIIFGMLMSPPTPITTAFWQWLNQTYNAGLNYGNRSGSTGADGPSEQEQKMALAKGYSAAVTSAVAVSVALRKMFAKRTQGLKGGKLLLMNSLVSYAAVACSGFANAFCMRMNEIESGIDMKSSNGEVVGKSQIAAKKAVIQTSFSRTILAIPVFAIPCAALYSIEKMGMMPKKFGPKTAVELSVLAVALTIAMPMAISFFPQIGSMSASSLEPQFQNLTDSTGKRMNEFYFNKGM